MGPQCGACDGLQHDFVDDQQRRAHLLCHGSDDGWLVFGVFGAWRLQEDASNRGQPCAMAIATPCRSVQNSMEEQFLGVLVDLRECLGVCRGCIDDVEDVEW